MAEIQIITNLEEDAVATLKGQLKPASLQAVGVMPAGMVNGNPSVALIVSHTDEHGFEHHFFAETTLKLFLEAGDIFKYEYGDPRVGPVNREPV